MLQSRRAVIYLPAQRSAARAAYEPPGREPRHRGNLGWLQLPLGPSGANKNGRFPTVDLFPHQTFVFINYWDVKSQEMLLLEPGPWNLGPGPGGGQAVFTPQFQSHHPINIPAVLNFVFVIITMCNL